MTRLMLKGKTWNAGWQDTDAEADVDYTSAGHEAPNADAVETVRGVWMGNAVIELPRSHRDSPANKVVAVGKIALEEM